MGDIFEPSASAVPALRARPATIRTGPASGRVHTRAVSHGPRRSNRQAASSAGRVRPGCWRAAAIRSPQVSAGVIRSALDPKSLLMATGMICSPGTTSRGERPDKPMSSRTLRHAPPDRPGRATANLQSICQESAGVSVGVAGVPGPGVGEQRHDVATARPPAEHFAGAIIGRDQTGRIARPPGLVRGRKRASGDGFGRADDLVHRVAGPGARGSEP